MGKSVKEKKRKIKKGLKSNLVAKRLMVMVLFGWWKLNFLNGNPTTDLKFKITKWLMMGPTILTGWIGMNPSERLVEQSWTSQQWSNASELSLALCMCSSSSDSRVSRVPLPLLCYSPLTSNLVCFWSQSCFHWNFDLCLYPRWEQLAHAYGKPMCVSTEKESIN